MSDSLVVESGGFELSAHLSDDDALEGSGIVNSLDVIASFISRVITEAIIAAAASAVTVGGSLAAFAASVTADACILMSRLSIRLAKRLRTVNTFLRRLGVADTAITKMTTTLRSASVRRAAALRRQAVASRAVARATAPTGKLAGYVGYTASAGASVLGKVDDVVGEGVGRALKEGVGAAAESYESIAGGGSS